MKTPKPVDSPVVPDADNASSKPATESTGTEAESKRPEEPWTPERVLEWNNYFDLFVSGFVLLLCFVAAANVINSPTVWTYLKAGQIIDETQTPLTTEPFSFAAQDEPWVNISWLFEWVSYRLFETGQSVARALDQDQIAESTGAGVLVAVAALLRLFAALAILAIRRPGPGLWWTAVMATLALGVTFSPVGGDTIPVVVGGIAGAGSVAPESWGLMFLAIELLLIHWAYNCGRRNWLAGIIPLFVIWCNVDISFLIGLFVLGAYVIGFGIKPSPLDETANGRKRPHLILGLSVLGLSALACLANPATYQVYGAALAPLIDVFRPTVDVMTFDRISLLPGTARGTESRELLGGEYKKLVGLYGLLFCAGFGSFLLNWKRFDLGRFLTFLVSSFLVVLLWRFRDFFAIIWAATIAINGQEWYHGFFGTDGKVGFAWQLWSRGGRLATIVLLTGAILMGVLGWNKLPGEARFGFSVETDGFAFEAADFLRELPIEGEVMNLKLSFGDALNWRAYPDRRSFIDTRPASSRTSKLLTEYDQIRKGLRDGDPEAYLPILDRYGVSVVMVEDPQGGGVFTPTMQALDASPDWVLFYDDGLALLYGRIDTSEAVPETDRTTFRDLELAPEKIAFGRGNPVGSFDRPPQAVDFIDFFSKGRTLAPMQSHVRSARRWIERGRNRAIAVATSETDLIAPSPAECLLAIQECRNALSIRPDDTDAFYTLAEAYSYLLAQENAILFESDPTLGNNLTPPIRIRLEQQMVALNFFLQTVPRPYAPAVRDLVQARHFELARIYQISGYSDLALEQLGKAIDLFTGEPSSEVDQQYRDDLKSDYDLLAEQVEQIRAQLDQEEIEGQVDPIQLAEFARQQGAVGEAIRRLEETIDSGLDPGIARLRLVDLYCDTGQPDRAIEYLGGPREPTLNSGPGSASFRQGRVWFLLGDYRTATDLWGSLAVLLLERSRTGSALSTTSGLMLGDPMGASRNAMTVSNQLAQQAQWEYLLGLALLEGGYPAESVEPLQVALDLDPEYLGAAIAQYYLESLGSTGDETTEVSPTTEVEDDLPARPEVLIEVPELLID